VSAESRIGLLMRGVVPARVQRLLKTRLLGLHRVRL
jgi:hypothetical protein